MSSITYVNVPGGEYHYRGITNFQQSSVTLGPIQIPTGASDGYILKSDAFGNASWLDPSGLPTDGPWIRIAPNVYLDNLSDKVIVGQNAPSGNEKFRVSGSVLFDGTGTWPVSGIGTRFIWSEDLKSIRAGDVTGNRWDSGNVGNYTAAFGQDTVASASFGTALGSLSHSRIKGQVAFSSANFSGATHFSNAQGSITVLMAKTTNAIPVEMTTDGAAPIAGNRFTLEDRTTYFCELSCSARREDQDNESAGFTFKFTIDRNTGAATTAIVGAIEKFTCCSDSLTWDINVSADTSNGSIKIDVTGEAGKNIRWAAKLSVSEVSSL